MTADISGKQKKVIIRVDGSNKIGMGHVVRSLNLARALKKAGWQPLFFSRGFPEAMRLIKEQGFAVKTLALQPKLQSSPFRKQEGVVLVIHDLLNTSLAYMLKLKQLCPPALFVNFDDLGSGGKAADVLIDANRPSGKKKFFGPDYILLKEVLGSFAKKTKRISLKVKQITVTLGGSDTQNYTGKVLNYLLSKAIGEYNFCFVLGPGFKDKAGLKKIAGKKANLSFKDNPGAKELAALLFNSDLCLASGGITMYELACLGVPAIVLCQAEHENKNAARFHRRGILKNLGMGNKVSAEKLFKNIRFLDEHKQVREKMSKRGRAYIDGKGLARIVKVIKEKC